MESLLCFHGLESGLHTRRILLVSLLTHRPTMRVLYLADTLKSYPETARLTLEEIDYLFIKEGNKGAMQLFKKSQPVIESLKPKSQIREDVERNEPEMLDEAMPSERKDELSEDEHKEVL